MLRCRHSTVVFGTRCRNQCICHRNVFPLLPRPCYGTRYRNQYIWSFLSVLGDPCMGLGKYSYCMLAGCCWGGPPLAPGKDFPPSLAPSSGCVALRGRNGGRPMGRPSLFPPPCTRNLFLVLGGRLISGRVKQRTSLTIMLQNAPVSSGQSGPA